MHADTVLLSSSSPVTELPERSCWLYLITSETQARNRILLMSTGKFRLIDSSLMRVVSKMRMQCEVNGKVVAMIRAIVRTGRSSFRPFVLS